ncbi:hypothetical protein INR77_00150 [Erythrobacter sp. SCSIO 43205]|uniref:CC_3452 family protein n=1 Tax=Erythrobacter sp. SCSIO 43205 TaxID=2779361 RepID=UPI001CA88FF1|nr:hypothetical protein [Erythrobacter sp. SCSIO 43205]UAB78208.1 hypothetical protein INR77_00150 [Erythrobacter sp. SCSIO 43205]
MSLSLPRAERIAVFASALAYTALTFGIATAPAPASADSGPYYTAQLAQPAEDDRLVAGGVAWACKGTTCVANKGSSRPSRICRGLARDVGEIKGFVANGEELAEDKLARCNGN